MLHTAIRTPGTLLALVLLAVTGLTSCGGDDGGDELTQGAVDEEAPLYDDLPAEVKEAGELVFAGDSHPPYRTVSPDGSEVTGIDPDLQAMLSDQLGVPIRIVITEGLPQMLSGMQSGRYDAFNGPVNATPERLQDFDGVTWMTSRTSYLVPTDGIEAESTDALCGTTTAGTKGSFSEEQASKLSAWCEEKGEEPVEFLGLADTNATLLAVKAGRADTVAITQSGALDVISQEEGDWTYVTQTDEQGAGVDQLVLLTPKSAEMGELMLSAFEGVFEAGDYDELVEKWGLEDVAVEEPVLNPTTPAP